jgi:hypothetical protein
MSSETSSDADSMLLPREWRVWVNGPGKSSRGGKKQDPPPPACHGGVRTVADMWRLLNGFPKIRDISVDSTVYAFVRGVEPRWEDPQNKEGGRWSYVILNANMALAADAWLNLCMGVFGGALDGASEILGISMGRRKLFMRFSIWTKDRFLAETILMIGNRVKSELPATVALEYQDHGAQFSDYRHKI